MNKRRIKILIENTMSADAFVGFSKEEWTGVKKFMPIFEDVLLSAITEPEPLPINVETP